MIPPAPRSKRLTLRDVIMHMMAMEQRLSGDIKESCYRIDSMDHKIDSLAQRVQQNTLTIRELHKICTENRDSIYEDIRLIAQDTISIRRFVGMPVPEET